MLYIAYMQRLLIHPGRYLVIMLVSMIATSCSKTSNTPPPTPGGNDTTVTVPVEPQVDPAIAATMGFFLDDWQAKTFAVPDAVAASLPAAADQTITVNLAKVITKIPSSIFSDNANLWMGQMITEPVLMNYLKVKQPGIIRFPGGSISDVFFWNAEKNIPPPDVPAVLKNADGTEQASPWWYGKNQESWTFSLDNYYHLLQQTGSKGLVTVNYGYARYGTSVNPVAAAAHLAAEWVRYDNGRTRYWEIGNENFGDWEAGYRINTAGNKDGQAEYVTGDLYAQHFKVFADSMRVAAQQTGKPIQIGAVLYESEPQSWQTNTVKTWNTGLLSNINNQPDFYVVHNYYTAYKTNASANEILATAAKGTADVMNYYKQTMQSRGATVKPLALDEWNITSEGSRQQVSFINGMHAAILLQEAIKNNYGMTSRWDLANGWSDGNDHGLFSLGETGSGEVKWTPRPAYYCMYYLNKMMGDRMVEVINSNTSLYAYASSFTSGQAGISLVNTSTTAINVKVDVKNFRRGSKVYWYQLTGGNDNGDFSRKVIVNNAGPSGVAGGPESFQSVKANMATLGTDLILTVPARAVIYAVVEKQ